MTIQQIKQYITELSPIVQGDDSKNEARLAALTGTLLNAQIHLKTLTRILDGTK